MELIKFQEEKVRSIGPLYLLNLSDLNTSNENKYDKSPKGCIDGPVISIVDFLNSVQEFYTTSSCSGRISVYEHGLSRKGINWLLVNHGTVTIDLIWDAIINKGIEGHNNILDHENKNDSNHYNENLLISFKCEPSIIHVCCHNLEGAKTLLHMVLACGFRESGLTISGSGKIMLAIRTNSDSLELPILLKSCLLYKKETLALVVEEANQRLLHNFARLDKLLDMLKKKYCWPQLSLSVDNIQQNKANTRWGHCSVTSSSSLSSSSSSSSSSSLSQLMIGGQGFDKSSEYRRNLHPCLSSLGGNENKNEEHVSMELHKEYGMHISACEWRSGLIVLSGGRRSWNIKNKDKDETNHAFLRIYDTKNGIRITTINRSTPTATTALEPNDRWGHSLSRINANSFLLFGGRNERGLVNDIAYQLTLTLQPLVVGSGSDSDSTEIFDVIYTWTLIDSPCYADPTIDAPVVVPAYALQRFFHAACPLELELAGRSNYISPTIVSINTNLNASTNTAEEDSASDSVLIFGGLNETSIGGLHSSAYPVAFIYSGIRNRFECVQLHNTDINHININSHDNCLELDRFGHTVTNIGYKTLALVGGTSFNPLVNSSDTIVSNSDKSNSNSSIHIGLLDYKFTNSGTLQFNYRKVSLALSTAAAASAVSNDCRCHHTTSCIRNIDTVQVAKGAHTKRLHVNGGGASFLSMGTHICSSVSVSLSLLNQSKHNDGCNIVSKTTTKKIKKQNTDHYDYSVEHGEVHEQYNMLIPKKHVKVMKTYLEKQQWLHKAFRITRMDPSSLKYIKYLDLRSGICKNRDNNLDINDTRMTTTEGEESNAYGFQTNGYMAIPLSTSFISRAVTHTEAFTDIELENLRSILQLEVDEIMITRQKNLRNKAESVSKFKKAIQFIKFYIDTHPSSPSSSTSMLMLNTLKFEIVGDILVIPEDKLVEEIFCTADFWSQLAECFKLYRVARKALIDKGPMRESRVHLLYQCSNNKNKNNDFNDGVNGWTTVVENGISFSFDITKVMFCSGNVTERTRTGQFAAKGQTIVDLYSGIGYYTIPFLVHAHAAIVHALEWNPNSVDALKVNVEAARKSMNNNGNKLGQCFIYQGDNRVTIENNHHLWGCADRISLGLLPSSTEGWALAVKCLKKEGGILHVHENVRDEEIGQWVVDACKEFTNLFSLQGQFVDIICLHVERVKSYSPRVLHIVCDLKVEPARK